MKHYTSIIICCIIMLLEATPVKGQKNENIICPIEMPPCWQLPDTAFQHLKIHTRYTGLLIINYLNDTTPPYMKDVQLSNITHLHKRGYPTDTLTGTDAAYINNIMWPAIKQQLYALKFLQKFSNCENKPTRYVLPIRCI